MYEKEYKIIGRGVYTIKLRPNPELEGEFYASVMYQGEWIGGISLPIEKLEELDVRARQICLDHSENYTPIEKTIFSLGYRERIPGTKK